LPAWDKVHFDLYSCRARWKGDYGPINGVMLDRFPKVSIASSRGCRGSCSFCSWTTFRNYRCRDPRAVYEEIKLLVQKYGQRHLFFTDDSWGTDHAKMLELCELIAPLKVAFSVSMRCDDIFEDGLKAMVKAGAYGIHLGLESGSPEVIKSAHKKTTVDVAHDALCAIRKHGIYTYAGIIVGLPGETDQTVEETRKFLRETKVDSLAILNGALLLPGTALTARAKREGLFSDDFWLTRQAQKVYLGGFTTKDLDRWRDRLTKFDARHWLTETANEWKRKVPLGRRGWIDYRVESN
jgi:radical SAM superfamily enzyme YgiQ (UPF0313 family)